MWNLFLLLYCVEYIYTFDEITTTLQPSPPPPLPTPRHGIDFIGPLWLPRTFKITCCRGGQPKADNLDLVSNWTQTVSNYAIDERGAEENENCRVFEGSFVLSATALFNFSFSGYGVQCECPVNHGVLDRHCRRLPPCLNNGYRSQSKGTNCVCPAPFFGGFCEKNCDQGQIINGVDGRSYCSCLPFYQGEDCTQLVCLNGGVEVHGRCSCPSNYLGYHCEIDGNRTAHGGRFQRFGESSDIFSRDISGTVFSLVMIIVLVVSMYLLMKHRMQVQTRYAASRREEMARAAAIYGISPRRGGGDILSSNDARIAPFVAVGIEGPPPYMARLTRGRRSDILPPLPSYEDATKNETIRASIMTDGVDTSEEQSSSSEHQAPPPHAPPLPPLPPPPSAHASSNIHSSDYHPLAEVTDDRHIVVDRMITMRRSL